MSSRTLALDDTLYRYLLDQSLRQHAELASLREATRTHPRGGGLIAVDNTLWSGRVARPAQDEGTAALQRFNRKLCGDERVDLSLLPIGDGLTLARRRNSAAVARSRAAGSDGPAGRNCSGHAAGAVPPTKHSCRAPARRPGMLLTGLAPSAKRSTPQGSGCERAIGSLWRRRTVANDPPGRAAHAERPVEQMQRKGGK